MVKRTLGAGRVLLGTAGGGVAETIAVGALCVAVGLDHPLNLLAFRQDEEAGEEFVHVFWVNGDYQRSFLF